MPRHEAERVERRFQHDVVHDVLERALWAIAVRPYVFASRRTIRFPGSRPSRLSRIDENAASRRAGTRARVSRRSTSGARPGAGEGPTRAAPGVCPPGSSRGPTRAPRTRWGASPASAYRRARRPGARSRARGARGRSSAHAARPPVRPRTSRRRARRRRGATGPARRARRPRGRERARARYPRRPSRDGSEGAEGRAIKAPRQQPEGNFRSKATTFGAARCSTPPTARRVNLKESVRRRLAMSGDAQRRGRDAARRPSAETARGGTPSPTTCFARSAGTPR